MAEERPDLPYEKAIEEAAKTLGKAVDVIKSAEPAISNIYGWMIGDRVAEARKRNADAFARKTKKIIEERDLKETVPLPEKLATPLLEDAQRESREELQNLYAALLANAMDPTFARDVRPEFIEIVKELEPIDVLLLNYMADTTSQGFFVPDVLGHFGGYRASKIHIALDNLRRLKLISPGQPHFSLTFFAVEFIVACDPHPTGKPSAQL